MAIYSKQQVFHSVRWKEKNVLPCSRIWNGLSLVFRQIHFWILVLQMLHSLSELYMWPCFLLLPSGYDPWPCFSLHIACVHLLHSFNLKVSFNKNTFFNLSFHLYLLILDLKSNLDGGIPRSFKLNWICWSLSS